ncbi:FG-GAP-like repeat-containing protein [Microbulbifer aggregans]|uniref:FG-GAP-like repeat-containing protein n=1 Tax=Microbulbifer aggregans TaxID=1769779 RepID=UPI001CFE90AF|nr:FG-GAP-like repeat-containing protein [Microbulbifer aggregans]
MQASYVWHVNGETVEGATEDTLESPNFIKGDEVTVDVVISDGEFTETASATTTILEAPPRFTVIGMPETAQYGEPVAFQVLIEDPDNDPFTWEFVARPNGMEMDESGTVSWTPTGPMFDTQIDKNWEIVATQGDEQYSFKKTIKVVDDDREMVLSRGTVYINPTIPTSTIGDFEGNGKHEILIVNGYRRLQTLAYDAGNYVLNWDYPYSFAQHTESYSSVAAADLNGDGRDQIIVGVEAHFEWSRDTTHLYVFDDNRHPQRSGEVPGNDVQVIRVANVDNDDDLEIVLLVGNHNYRSSSDDAMSQKHLVILNASDLSLKWQSSVMELGSSIAVGNVDADPYQEIATDKGYVFGFNGTDYEIEWHYEEGFDEKTAFADDFIPLEIVDVDGDGQNEIVASNLRLFDARKQELKSSPGIDAQDFTVFDLDGDNHPEFLTREQIYTFDTEGTGNFIALWDTPITGMEDGNIHAANMDNDPDVEFFVSSGSDHRVYASSAGDSGPTLEWTTDHPSDLYSVLHNPHFLNLDGSGEKIVLSGLNQRNWETQMALIDPESGAMAWRYTFPRQLASYRYFGIPVDLGGDGTTELFHIDETIPGVFDFTSESISWNGEDTGSKVLALEQGNIEPTSQATIFFTTEDNTLHAYDTATLLPIWRLENIEGNILNVHDINSDGKKDILTAGLQTLNLVEVEESDPVLSTTFSLQDIETEVQDESYSRRLNNLEITSVSVGTISPTSGDKIVLTASLDSYAGSWLIVLNTDFTLYSFTAYDDRRIHSGLLQNYGEGNRNLLLDVQLEATLNPPFIVYYYDHYFMEVSPENGKIVSMSPGLSADAIPRSMKYVDTNNDGIQELLWSTAHGSINATR